MYNLDKQILVLFSIIQSRGFSRRNTTGRVRTWTKYAYNLPSLIDNTKPNKGLNFFNN